jgi:hypothetical protein
VTKWEWSARVLSAQGPESPTVRLVLLAVLSFYNDAQGRAWPGVESIAERSGHKSVRTVQDALGEAESSGWLRREAKPGRVTFYFPALPEDRGLTLTPAKIAGLPPQRLAPTPARIAGGPAAIAGEPSREGSKEPKKEGPPCPDCSAETYLQPSARGEFWGCPRFRSHGCRGRVQIAQDHALTARKLTASAAAQREKAEREKRADAQTAGSVLAELRAKQAEERAKAKPLIGRPA